MLNYAPIFLYYITLFIYSIFGGALIETEVHLE